MASAGAGAASSLAHRRAVRLRREFLYRKGLEGKEREQYEKKRAIREALRDGKPLPTELRAEEASLRHEIEAEDAGTEKPRSSVDDEYAAAGVSDPKVCVSTSRDPSARLKMFAKEVRLLFPNSQRVNRGNHTTAEIVDACRRAAFTDLVMVQETRGEPDALVVSHLPFGPTVYFSLRNSVMRHDIEDVGTMSEAAPHLIFHNFSTKLGTRVRTVLKHLFPVPKADSKRTMTFANDNDFISFRHHTFTKESGSTRPEDVTLTEVGPRFELRPYQVKLGTVDQRDAEDEWVLRPYMNTARTKQAL